MQTIRKSKVITSDYTVELYDYGKIFVETDNNVTITIPTPDSDFDIFIKNNGTGSVTVQRVLGVPTATRSNRDFDGAGTLVMEDYTSYLISYVKEVDTFRVMNQLAAGNIGGGASAMVVSFSAGTTKTVRTNSTTYEAMATFNWSGVDKIGVIKNFLLNAWREGGSGSIDFRIYDIINNQVIAEVTGITSTDPANNTLMGAISNLPSSATTFQLQGKKSGGTAAHSGSLTMEYFNR